ncbi:hypothetical protein BC941DRAFT_437224 [Chlamydoabsidia padenii]|nr:hypothetical protein BC941DRAFT_437224 [Chlamydoabsidia padenii]
MAPIVLKIKDNGKSFSPFAHMASEGEDLSKTWRVCTKIKDSLENGSRLENLSWRLWFVHNVLNDNKATQQNDLQTMERQTSWVNNKVPFDGTCEEQWTQQPQPRQNNAAMNPLMMEEFVLHQYTSDQACDQVVQLDNTLVNNDLFGGFNKTMIIDDSTGQPIDITNYATPSNKPFDHHFYDPHVTQIPLSQSSSYIPTLDDILDFYNASHNNKLLSTLPPQTLASAERLLSPVHQIEHTATNYQHQHISTGILENNGLLTTDQRQAPFITKPTIIKSTPSEGQVPICSNCEATSTPIWRRSSNDNLLCNACGLYWKLHKVPRPKYLKTHSMIKDWRMEDGQRAIQLVCSNCATMATPLWRRDLEGQPLCNACGL